MKTFAAIDIGSFELSMKIFEFTKKNPMREIDHIRYRIDLGSDTYSRGKIEYEKVDELCRILREFRNIMDSYQVVDYVAYGTSAIRETDNTFIILDQIRIRTGFEIQVLSNSEQRFLDYKSIASKGETFTKIIEKGTAIVDIGGGSIQLSLFDKDSLVTTQNLRLGVLRMRERLNILQPKISQYENLVEEMVSNQLSIFKKLYMKDREIKHIIIVDDYVSMILNKRFQNQEMEHCFSKQEFFDFLTSLKHKNHEEISRTFDIPVENASLLYLSAMLIKQLMKIMDVELLYAPGVTLCDGIAYEYAEKNKLFVQKHNFEQDIIACAQNISKRYMGSKSRGEILTKICLTLFDSMKKIHGLSKRERLLLELAAILHDCGKYISLATMSDCGYHIIMSTEIIGLSHLEREMVANIVKYNYIDFGYYEEVGKYSSIDKESYLKIAKLTALLRVGSGLDRSHKQKFETLQASLQDDLLIITTDNAEDITLEKGLFESKAQFFEEVFSVRPVIKQRKKGNSYGE